MSVVSVFLCAFTHKLGFNFIMRKADLKQILEEIGWSQAELSRRVGVSEATITRWVEVPGPVEAYIRLVYRLIGGDI